MDFGVSARAICGLIRSLPPRRFAFNRHICFPVPIRLTYQFPSASYFAVIDNHSRFSPLSSQSKMFANCNSILPSTLRPRFCFTGFPSAHPQVRRLSTRKTNWDQSESGNSPGNSDKNSDEKRKKLISRFGVIGTIVAVLATKTKWVFAALKLGKFSTLASMLLSTVAYSAFFGWPYAVGMVSQMLIHESGHALEMRRQGIPTTPMVFIPFMGAVIGMKDQPRNAYKEALVALAGPWMGSFGAFWFSIAGTMNESQLMLALAEFGFMINLFNLLPIGSMDGGRIAGALSKWFLVVGLAAGGYMAYAGVIRNPILYIILLAAGYSTFVRFTGGGIEVPGYFKITPQQRIVICALYFGLILILFYAQRWNNRKRKSPRQLEEEARIRREQQQRMW